MKISIMQMYKAMNTTPEFCDIIPAQCIAIANKAVKIRKQCLELIKAGERCLTVLSNALDVHRTTLILYLKELCDSGFIVFITKPGAKIVNVL